ncbi:hypothetical protein [Streptomyces sp. NPDC047079]|uniref:hypothetical protein n=1 Tax=Streptomyces sp. NPDC047079 TaxID=3154607 RepID=UPI0034014261
MELFRVADIEPDIGAAAPLLAPPDTRNGGVPHRELHPRERPGMPETPDTESRPVALATATRDAVRLTVYRAVRVLTAP